MGWLRLTMHPTREQFVKLEINGVEVWVYLDDVAQRQAKLAFLAPPDVKINRGSVLERMGQGGTPPTRPGE